MLKEREQIRFKNYHLQFCIIEVRIVLISVQSLSVVEQIMLPEENLPLDIEPSNCHYGLAKKKTCWLHRALSYV